MTHQPVAIVGMGALFPGASNLAEYWNNLVRGVDSVTDVPADRWDESLYDPAARDHPRADAFYCRRGGFVEADIDPARFGIMPNSVDDIEPDQLIALRVAADAIDDAGGNGALPHDRSRIGVVLGRGGYLTPGLVRLDQQVRTAHQLVRTLGEIMPDMTGEQLQQVKEAFQAQLRPPTSDAAIGLVPNLSASRIANRLDLRGPAYTVDAACASSLVAIDQAIAELASGRCDMMLAGGVHHCHDVTLWSVFNQLGALSPAQQIRPFDARADGVLIGEGTGIIALKRLADAERDGDRVYAVITGTGVASDGRTASLFNPDPSGQVTAVQRAWEAAALDPTAPGAIGLLEAHGTGTVAGDSAELRTLAEVFGTHAASEQQPVIGTVKSMIGHAMPAAGAAGIIKAALALHHRTLLPTLHCEQPHAMLSASRFAPIAEARPWQQHATGQARRAGVNAFGFGGINAHIILEEAPARATTITVREPRRILRLAAPTAADLATALDVPDADLLATTAMGSGPARIAIDEPTPKRLNLARKAVARGVPWRGRSSMWFTPAPLLGPGGGKIAMVFPGLEAEFAPDVTEVARELGMELGGTSMSTEHLGAHGAAVFQLGRVLHRALTERGVTAGALAGHSVGEWSAMTQGGMFDKSEIDTFLDRFDPASITVPGVEFAVIGTTAARVREALHASPEVVLSHDNAPNQSMVCGPGKAVTALVEQFRAEGIISQVLPFQSGFHTPMLIPFLEPIIRDLDALTIRASTVPVWSATTTEPFPADPIEIRAIYLRHLVETVRFRELITRMHDAGNSVFIQMGTGQVSALIGDILHDREHLAIPAHTAKASSADQLDRVMAALWVEGHHAGTEAPAARQGRRMSIAMGGPLVSIPMAQRASLASQPRLTPASASQLEGVPAASAWGAEFSALVADTQRVARELMTAASAPAAARPATPRVRPAARAPHSPAQQPPAPQPPGPRPIQPSRTTLDVSLEAMPYLIDHSFFKMPDGWPVDEDRWPVVPATTLVHHMMEHASRSAPGCLPVALTDVRFQKWLPVIPSVTVPITVEPEDATTVNVTLQGHARARIAVGNQYPAQPGIWRVDPSTEHPPTDEAHELYTRRWMFHGPRFQGVTELTAIGDRHVRGLLRTPAAPGALLDNAGQLLGYWVQTTMTERSTVFPVGMDRIEFHSAHPEPGSIVECTILIREVTHQAVTADIQLITGGTVWAQITGWQDRRFDSNPAIRATDCAPEHNTLATLHPEGWAEVAEMWPDLATRELVVRKMLGATERDQYAVVPPRRKRQWLLGRIAAKDAIRQLLWQTEDAGIFPQEIEIGNAGSGAPFAIGTHGRSLPPLAVSIAHCAELGVAIAASGPCGIDVEEVLERDATTENAALTDRELELLDVLAGSEANDRALWFTRFWTAKEAVAKKLGTGLDGAPKQFEVIAANQASLIVRHQGIEHQVRTTVTRNPQPLPPRTYVVAWTEHSGTRHTDEGTENP
ncbi:beta-ketoacyl synthase N-terminal-like domain-containing protein [Lolliginicoccus levis]|uniref:beta-ketoacyl synthase N-terminal-like domain-containing protein n=1 Tax=Lolliginicoccus levis TaxID=2919542 RepID=UPI00241E1042|nr:beta-ketoacyl synthase N-terminal-like domain-containing protein [Lolliginicoccus levis]